MLVCLNSMTIIADSSLVLLHLHVYVYMYMYIVYLHILTLYVCNVENVRFLVVSIITMLWFMCTPGVPLTPSNVIGAVEEVRRVWREIRGLRLVLGLAARLCIPQSKEDEIKHNFPDELEQKKQMISYWINTDPLAGWRRLITALDWIRETHLIRSNAEPLTGIIVKYMMFIMYTLIHVMFIPI